MMATTNSGQDLNSILANLARFAPPTQPNNSGVHSVSVLTPEIKPNDQGLLPVIEKHQDPRLKPQSRATASPKPIDPATITTWQDGLRCVTKIAAQNAQFAASIKRMMEDQRKHEMRWYSERQALKQAQANRPKSSAQAHSILKSLVSGEKKASVSAETAVDGEAELAALDRRIYASQQDMEISMTAEMKGLGVPFFGTDRSLVVDGDENPPGKVRDDLPKWSPMVTKTQLLELRRRMVGHLEELYRD